MTGSTWLRRGSDASPHVASRPWLADLAGHLHRRAMVRAAAATRLTLVDIGAAGGVQQKWLPHRHRIRPVLFEPNPQEAARLRPALARFPDALVVECGLGAASGPATLHLAEWPGCSSLREADPDVLAGYRIAPLYRPVGEVSVQCERYDELHAAGRVPTPDIIKVDVEGTEHEVLSGFGDLLHGVLGIEAEAWFQPVFRGQKLLHDLVTLLAGFGLTLRQIEPVPGFEGDLVCVNAFFTRGRAGLAAPAQRAGLALLQRVWGLDRT
jgi:FkbM family methyltransferase